MSTATKKKDKIYIRDLPKVITLWPTALVCLCMGLATHFSGEQFHELWGGIFMAVLAFNLIVLTFEFPRTTSLTVAAVVVALIFGFILLNQRYEIWPAMKGFFTSLRISASPGFYYTLFTIMTLIGVAIYATAQFDYWELSANELVHRQGLFGDVERFPTSGLKFNCEVSDVFERAIVGTGRLVMSLPALPRPIVLDNVWRIHKISDEADLLLEARTVRVEHVGAAAQTDAARLEDEES